MKVWSTFLWFVRRSQLQSRSYAVRNKDLLLLFVLQNMICHSLRPKNTKRKYVIVYLDNAVPTYTRLDWSRNYLCRIIWTTYDRLWLRCGLFKCHHLLFSQLCFGRVPVYPDATELPKYFTWTDGLSDLLLYVTHAQTNCGRCSLIWSVDPCCCYYVLRHKTLICGVYI